MRLASTLRLAGIAAIIGTLAFAFIWLSGRIGGHRLTGAQLINAMEANNAAPSPGFRRAHSKGICVSGRFFGNGAGSTLSVARVFAQKDVPVTGRFSIGGGNPYGADNTARVRSMALRLRTDDGQEWRMAMNNFPFFAVATPEGFHAQTLASRPDPITGQPDPAQQAALLEQHPEIRKFQTWATSAPWPDSWANTEYNSVNAFRLVAADGGERHMRWTMRPQTPLRTMTADERQYASADFLAEDLHHRLKQAPLRWEMVLTLAEPDDPVNDPSQPWPDERQMLSVGVLDITTITDQGTASCRDLNFDPLILPTGIAASNDPILAARSGVYAHSFNRRQWEIARGQARSEIAP